MSADDRDRFPTLTEAGARMLRFLKEHPSAPRFRNESGNRLTVVDLRRVRFHEERVLRLATERGYERTPTWLSAYVASVRGDVPAYRDYPDVPFTELPTTSRAELAADITRFFPDSVPIERLIHFSTSGTTGHPLVLASHPVVAASYLVFHKLALARFGIELRHGAGQVGVALLGWQQHCFTYVSVTPTMRESGLVKLNLHPDDWREPGDRARYLDAIAAEVWTGDPISLAEAARLPVTVLPRAVLSTSMTLLPGLRAQFEERFGCPVLDLYSLNEVGPVAVADKRAGGHVLLQPDLHVEILDMRGQPVAPGERGEITVTGGFNFCLPLLRYRTGDHASLGIADGKGVLVGLEGRPPVRFRRTDGKWLNNIEVTHALKGFALAQWALHQEVDGALVLRVRGAEGREPELRRTLHELLGDGARLAVTPFAAGVDKVVQYTSDLPGGRA